jgi:hypothetical protein
VQAPNSTPRAIKVIALDGVSEVVVRRLADAGWKHATFLTAADAGRDLSDPASSESAKQDAPHDPSPSTLCDLTGESKSVTDEVDTADLVILVAGPGGRARAAPLIGQACSLRSVMTTGFVVGVSSASEHALSKTLAQLRPWSLMVVIARSDEYIDDMMTALRA